MAEPDWYEIAADDALLQGDLLPGFPVAVVTELPLPIPEDYQPLVDVHLCDVVVMTQSCDLAHAKVEDILLARMHKWPDYIRANPGNTNLRSEDFRKSLVAGNVPNLFLLHKRDAEPVLPWSVVDFRRVSTSSKTFVQRFLSTIKPRLRLISPYREHLSQAFARYFMRVGLPLDAKMFVKDGKVDPVSF